MECASYKVSIGQCAWCHLPIEDHEKARTCDCPRHQGEEETFCSRSCKVAAHG